MLFRYQTEPIRPAVVILFALLIAAILIPVPLVQLVLFATATGPAVWALLQWRRRNLGVTLNADSLDIDRTLRARPVHIPFNTIEGYTITPKGVLTLVHRPKAQPVQTNTQVALTDLRPQRVMRQQMIITAALVTANAENHTENNTIENNTNVLDQQLRAALTNVKIPHEIVQTLLRRRRVRNIILLLLAVLGTPIYVIVGFRILASFAR
jgi:hypothetical protein